MTLSLRAAAPPSLSYELDPPASPEAEASLLRAIEELEATGPDYVSVTYSGSCG